VQFLSPACIALRIVMGSSTSSSTSGSGGHGTVLRFAVAQSHTDDERGSEKDAWSASKATRSEAQLSGI
jgi:hypothetical protein